MSRLPAFAKPIKVYLAAVDGVVRCSLYGGLAECADECPDIDIELAVSGSYSAAFDPRAPGIVSVRSRM